MKRLTHQDALDYIGTALIVLGGIGPLALASGLILPTWATFTIGLAVMALTTLQQQYQRKLKRGTAQRREKLLIQENVELRTKLAAAKQAQEPTPPAGTYGANQ